MGRMDLIATHLNEMIVLRVLFSHFAIDILLEHVNLYCDMVVKHLRSSASLDLVLGLVEISTFAPIAI
jgi:hypothetical protein